MATQPDLGTAGTILLIAAAMTVFTKVERKTFIVLSMVVVLAIPAGWKILEPYQKERLHTLLSPESDPLGAGYHIRQSKIAVGSGQVFGKGYLEGTQKNYHSFRNNIRILFFSACRGMGICRVCAGIVHVSAAHCVCGQHCRGCRDAFGTILCVGIAAMIFLQVFVNMAMVMGLMPVVGMPLPLVSYGGSSIFTIFLGIGLLMNVSIRRYVKQ
ncbi:MAG: FtsW/RodA/SpoVE family cell cycle protein [Desulfobacterales bacterium]